MGQLQAGVIPVTPFQQNCTILFDSDTKQAVVVDPGGDVDKILAIVDEQGLAVKEIWITHGHIDHAGGAEDLRAALGVPVTGPHTADKPLLDALPTHGAALGIDLPAKAVTPDRWLQDGDVVELGEHRFEVLHCPGHAPGHVIFFNREMRFCIMGDVLFNGSIGRTDLPGGNHQQLLDSIRDKVLPLGDDVGFLCGHGPASRIGDERRNNPFLRGL
ncbi:MBL fold metallo-hydrolase [Rhizobium sp. SSA_523]|uniref:MBL fold metallo-hydrolase n=1 Tax=Rhizobium sp. SSA_523 TaxID=2952477 RepID=UPI00209104BD|nr:MBL fold metallo-hydrolase [Rhizobium sp. SSA_523]MCO5730393.1 MBL fold metallo-hydrolase [Rhizobium sp. SSA_523]WKC25437.1 MBL fold metallo-hydrolase [Rhizobium sp. SSA_523]